MPSITIHIYGKRRRRKELLLAEPNTSTCSFNCELCGCVCQYSFGTVTGKMSMAGTQYTSHGLMSGQSHICFHLNNMTEKFLK